VTKTHIIRLDAKATSTLNWNAERKNALSVIAEGKKILWHLDFGLFQELPKPIADKAQFLSLGLALEHFTNTLWKEFQRFSKGVLIYRTDCGHFLQNFVWNDEQIANLRNWLKERFTLDELGLEMQQPISSFDTISLDRLALLEEKFLLHLFVRDVTVDYLEQLALKLPQEIDVYMDLALRPENSWLNLCLTHPDRYKLVKLLVSHPWKIFESKKAALCMPNLNIVQTAQLAPFKNIQQTDLKYIPEEMLTYAWEGLDCLFYSSQVITPQGMRKVQGFCAAGGQAVDI